MVRSQVINCCFFSTKKINDQKWKPGQEWLIRERKRERERERDLSKSTYKRESIRGNNFLMTNTQMTNKSFQCGECRRFTQKTIE